MELNFRKLYELKVNMFKKLCVKTKSCSENDMRNLKLYELKHVQKII